jgi:uncharacterized protein DUF2441
MMSFLHLTSWTISPAHIGTAYSTNWGENTHWRSMRTFTTQASVEAVLQKIRSLQEALAHSAQRNDIALSIRAEIARLGLPQVLADGLTTGSISVEDLLSTNRLKFELQVRKERIFEEVRAQDFPDRPSRQRCLFAFPENLDPASYLPAMGFQMAGRTLVRITAAEDAKVHFANLSLLNAQLASDAQIAESARAYWSGKDTSVDKMTTEVLVEGNFIIEEVITLENLPPR